jgi:hypothetical protein
LTFPSPVINVEEILERINKYEILKAVKHSKKGTDIPERRRVDNENVIVTLEFKCIINFIQVKSGICIKYTSNCFEV